MGNTNFEETALSSLPRRLERLLPSTWAASIAPSPRPFDAVVAISGPGRARAELVVTFKRWTTAPTSAVAGTLSNLRASSDKPLLLVTDYTNRPLRSACEALGVNYIDDADWAFLSLDTPPIFIKTTGTDQSVPRLTNEVTRLNGVAVGRIMRALLEAQPPLGVRELAQQADVKSPGSVSKLLPTLVASNAIERDQTGRVTTIRRRVLLDRWVQDYSFLKGNGVALDFLAPRGMENALDRLRVMKDVCVTGAFAAQEYLTPGSIPVVPATRLSVYSREAHELARALGLVRVDRMSSNVIIAAPRDSTLVSRPKRRNSGLPVPPIGQLLADLLTLPGRETTLADQLMDQLARTDPLWRSQ